MIFIKILLNYAKSLGSFLIIEIFIAFLMSLLNLIGVSNQITNIVLFISNLIIFMLYGYLQGLKTNKKGFIEGLLIGGLLITILFVITLIFFIKTIRIGTLFYYLILLFCSMVGATIGKNKKAETNLK